VERRVELYKQVGATNDLTVSANSLKRRWQKRQRLNNAEKKLLLPVKKDSSDERPAQIPTPYISVDRLPEMQVSIL